MDLSTGGRPWLFSQGPLPVGRSHCQNRGVMGVAPRILISSDRNCFVGSDELSLRSAWAICAPRGGSDLACTPPVLISARRGCHADLPLAGDRRDPGFGLGLFRTRALKWQADPGGTQSVHRPTCRFCLGDPLSYFNVFYFWADPTQQSSAQRFSH